MKVTIEVDCTPQEARTFLGLPDLQPLQDGVVEEMNRRALQTVQSMDPQTLLRLWMPTGWQGIEELQKMLLGQLGGQFGGAWGASKQSKPETET